MSISAFLRGKYLAKEDFERPTRVVIREWKEEMVGAKDGPKNKRAVLYFQGYDKGMVLNKTNIKRLIRIFGTEDDSEWIGKAVVLKNDPTVEFGGELTGGLRFDPLPQRSANTDPVPMRQPGEDDEVFTA